MHIGSLVQTALERAAGEPLSRQSRQELHRERSSLFVENLATQLRRHSWDWDDVVVLSKHIGTNRERFGLNELLFDILVCRTAHTSSASRNEDLTYVTRGLWAIESELARDSREAILDFNKLVLASCENALFVGPQVADEVAFLKPLAAAAAHCSANVHLALIPHPSVWNEESALGVRSFNWRDDKWVPVKS
jgi:hypothetical protein